MKSLLFLTAFAAYVLCLASRARAAEAVTPLAASERVRPLGLPEAEDPDGRLTAQAGPPLAPPSEHPTPKLKISYMRYGIGDGSGGTIPLQALHLDMYPLSWRYLRMGVEVEAGRGRGKLLGTAASVTYGMLGMNMGLQIPRRITPFIEGRFSGGILAARADGALMIPGTSISVNGAGAATWMYSRGVDVGVEVYTFNRGYISAAMGWMRTTWHTADFDSHDSVVFKNVSHDSLLLKVGLGI